MKISRSTAMPYIVWMIIFTVIPLILVTYFAFTDGNGTFTMANISEVKDYVAVIFRSIWLAFVATVICLIIAYPLAYVVSRASEKKQKTYLLLVMLPMWMNFLLRTYAWMTLLENTGIINKLLAMVGLGPFFMINTQGAVVLGMVYNYLPFMILPLYSIMAKIDNRLIEAAQDLGAPSGKVFSQVVWPLSIPGVMSRGFHFHHFQNVGWRQQHDDRRPYRTAVPWQCL